MGMQIRKNLNRALVVLGASCISVGAVGAAEAAITIPMVPVGNAGNAADTTGFGSVSYAYNIGQTDVTAAQYTAFLNAVAKTDTYGLYNSNMASSFAAAGISQSGSSGSYTYATTKNGNFPVNYVTWGDAARFANWLTNNQPTGTEGNGTTETGSYTLNGATSNEALLAVTRNANANYVIPTENEWYKAAYYNPASSSYYLYTTSSNSQPSNVLSATGTNNANYYDEYNGSSTDPTNYLTPVGAFADSVSPYGTYDQGGDLFQWNESVYSGSYRRLRGGSFEGSYEDLQSGNFADNYPADEYANIGFRVSQVPEPASMGVLGLGVAGMLVRRRGARK
jgi:formylglycine-generating enzyme required for sulfatase activity